MDNPFNSKSLRGTMAVLLLMAAALAGSAASVTSDITLGVTTDEVLTTAGSMVTTACAPAGERTSVKLAPGLYVVRAAGVARLIAVE